VRDTHGRGPHDDQLRLVRQNDVVGDAVRDGGSIPLARKGMSVGASDQARPIGERVPLVCDEAEADDEAEDNGGVGDDDEAKARPYT